jgi:trehalose 6-phosphate synthase/phosphatase
MDYTKGIPNRIKSFEYFLNKYPQYREKVRLVMLAVPSRENVAQYQLLKREIDELVGRINGDLSTISWTPIWYFYRSLPFDQLIDLYVSSDVAMVTPVRDGMNLVAKEYVAARTNTDGVLILSEMAGAAKEMHEAIIVNPNNFEQIADSIAAALEMPQAEQHARMEALQKRISRYDVERWAKEFLKGLKVAKETLPVQVAVKLEPEKIELIAADYQKAQKKLFLLDYDGTLVGFKNNPLDAYPNEELYELLDKINSDPTTELAIISGRDRATLNKWFGHKNYTLVSDHGAWMRKVGSDWEALDHLKSGWKDNIRPVLEAFTDSTPGSLIEEKEYSIAWHYRKVDVEMAALRTMELKHVLKSLLFNNSLSLLDGNKVIEVKNSNINKGRAASRVIGNAAYDFIFSIGDDWTDEFMFEELTDNNSAYTVKVGNVKTVANYYINNNTQVHRLLDAIIGN